MKYKRKCERCKKWRNKEYEFIGPKSVQCVFCDDEDRSEKKK
jgi:hypothetical protein